MAKNSTVTNLLTPRVLTANLKTTGAILQRQSSSHAHHGRSSSKTAAVVRRSTRTKARVTRVCLTSTPMLQTGTVTHFMPIDVKMTCTSEV